jgi:cation diffusion facilitator family transporter
MTAQQAQEAQEASDARQAHEAHDARRAQQRTALFSVVAAAGLVAIKLITSLLTGSLGLLAEAMHSGTDLVAALLTFYSVRVAVRPPDRDHPFGHGKAEHLSALGEAAFLALVSGFIAFASLRRLANEGGHEVDAAWYAIAVLVVVLVIDASRTVISLRTSRRYGSPALAANALHFGSDLLGTSAVLLGLLLVRAGYHDADAIAALVVAALVIIAAVRLMRENVNVLMDRSPAAAEADARHAILTAEPGIELRRMRVRQAAGRHFVDAVVGIEADAAIGQGHALADRVEEAVHQALPGSDVVVHVEPAIAHDLRERVSGAALTVRGVREVHNVSIIDVDGRRELSLHLKLPPDVRLAEAHEVADEVERAILDAVPEIIDIHIHIEPLAQGAAAEAEQPLAPEVAHVRRAIRDVVRDVTGSEPRDVRIRRGPDGLLALLTVCVPGDRPLGEAHDAAGEIERRVRDASPEVNDVVVHTEPG